jgi:TolB-like protein/tetratricopeptide (TPR) repeat protein
LLYIFGDYALDTDRRELRRGNGLIALQPQVFDLLEYLIRNRDRVLAKDDLLAAVWGGRIVSDSTMSARINMARGAIGDDGKDQRLIKTVARKGFRFVGAVHEQRNARATALSATDAALPSPTSPDPPSIAVLAFTNMSGDPDQAYFADGIVEEIITALSRFSGLFVIARNSTFTYKGRAVDVRQVGRELGVRYVLEGSVRKAANRIRITGQLIEAATGTHLWADRFDGTLEDIFDLQDQLTLKVVAAIVPKLEQAEIDRAKHRPTDSSSAHDFFLRGMARFHEQSRTGTYEARLLFYRAIELDPEFARAYGMVGWCYTMTRVQGWILFDPPAIAEARRHAEQAVALGRDDSTALCAGGFALALAVGEPDRAIIFIDRALMLNPNLAIAWFASGWVRVCIGEQDLAIQHLAQATRLNPLDPRLYSTQTATAFAHFFAGRYAEATLWSETAVRAQPDWRPGLRILAASCALAGRMSEAQNAMSRMLAIDPTRRIANLHNTFGGFRDVDFLRYADALRKAGMPE